MLVGFSLDGKIDGLLLGNNGAITFGDFNLDETVGIPVEENEGLLVGDNVIFPINGIVVG